MDDPRPNLQSEASRLASTARERAADAVEEFKLASNQLVDKIRELIEEGNVRRISLRKGERTLLEIPLTVGVGAGAAALLLNPVLAAVGALAALATDVTLVVEREEGEEGGSESSGASSSGSGSSGSGASSKGSGSGTSGSGTSGSGASGSGNAGSGNSGSGNSGSESTGEAKKTVGKSGNAGDESSS